MFLNKLIVIIFTLIFQSLLLINEEFFVLISFFLFLFITKWFLHEVINQMLNMQFYKNLKKIKLKFIILKKQILRIKGILIDCKYSIFMVIWDIISTITSFIKEIHKKLTSNFSDKLTYYYETNFESFLNKQIWENHKFMYKIVFTLKHNLIQNLNTKLKQKFISNNLWKITR